MSIDLYRTLEVSPRATDEEIKRAYRRIALLYHPDRNQAGMEAEDRFKEANYAYSILRDREKRRRYDLYREFKRYSARWGIPQSISQERILTELFLDPKLPGLGTWLDEIFRTKDLSSNRRTFWIFSRATLRFLRQVYEEEKGKRESREKTRRPRIASYPKTVLKKFGSTLFPFGTARRGADRAGKAPPFGRETYSAADIEWTLPLTREEATHGTRLTLSIFRDSHWDRLSLLVPAGTREGVRLRVRNKGNRASPSGETGDLYLRVMIR